MNMESLVRETLREWSGQARLPAGLADQVLRHRSRRRFLVPALVAGATAIVVGVAAVIGAVTTGVFTESSGERGAGVLSPAGGGIRADTGNWPPRRLMAAGQVAMSAYYTLDWDTEMKATRFTWYLYQPAKDAYAKTPWAHLDVAPGMRVAAVLEGPLPARRVGLLDMETQKVARWITLDHRAGAVTWSPDGRKLLVTTYGRHPDEGNIDGLLNANGQQHPDALKEVPQSSRSGFSVVDVASGKETFTSRPAYSADPDDAPPYIAVNTRQDFRWSRDGTSVWTATEMEPPTRYFYDLTGKHRRMPKHESDADQPAWLSPDGRLLATRPLSDHVRPDGTYAPRDDADTAIKDLATGREILIRATKKYHFEQLVAWADSAHLIATACDQGKCGNRDKWGSRYVLVRLKDRKAVPLSGLEDLDRQKLAWMPLFTRR